MLGSGESMAEREKTSNLGLAARVTRAPFFTASLVPVLLGTTIAWSDGFFSAGYFALTLLGALCVHAAINIGNDFFDHLSGNDAANPHPTPFSGGSRVIQQGLLSAKQMLALSILFYVLTIAIGIYLAINRGWVILLIGLLGLGLAIFHNWRPIGLYYLAPGVGEAAVGLGFGTLMVLGAYYVQAQHLNLSVAWASLPIALLIAAVLYINEFPDYIADKSVGKRTMVAILGPQVAVGGYVVLMVGAYVAIIAGLLGGLLPWTALITLPTVPWAYRSIRRARRFHSDISNLLPTNIATIKIHLSVGLLLCLAYALARLLV